MTPNLNPLALRQLYEALQPFVVRNSNSKLTTIMVWSSQIRDARAALAAATTFPPASSPTPSPTHGQQAAEDTVAQGGESSGSVEPGEGDYFPEFGDIYQFSPVDPGWSDPVEANSNKDNYRRDAVTFGYKYRPVMRKEAK